MIRADYEAFLGRQPAPAELTGWLRQVQAGLGEGQVEAAFLASSEYFSRHGGANLPWLKGVYHDVLGRAADPGGLNAWSQELRAGASRDSVATAIVASPEAESRLVTAAYLDLLKRNPDPPGLATWVAGLQHGLTPAELLAVIASSKEYIGLTAQGVLDIPPAPVPIPVPIPVETPFPVAVPVDPFFGEPFLGDPFGFGTGDLIPADSMTVSTSAALTVTIVGVIFSRASSFLASGVSPHSPWDENLCGRIGMLFAHEFLGFVLWTPHRTNSAIY